LIEKVEESRKSIHKVKVVESRLEEQKVEENPNAEIFSERSPLMSFWSAP
jgi:hypothetical protein